MGLERAQILAVLTQFPRCNFVVPLQAPEECEARDRNMTTATNTAAAARVAASALARMTTARRATSAVVLNKAGGVRHSHALALASPRKLVPLSGRAMSTRPIAATAAKDKAAPADGYYVQSSGCDEGECYTENAVSREQLQVFESAFDANRAGAASVWKSAVKMMRSMSTSAKRPACTVSAEECSTEYMKPAIVYTKECFATPQGCPCISGKPCICRH